MTIYVDARRPGVSVPAHLQGEARLVLQYGLNMPVPVEDLEVTEGGIKATLSFSRQPHSTLIPWTAVYVIACTDGRGVLYQEDVPAELLTTAPDAEPEGAEADARPALASVAPAAGPPAEDDAEPAPPPPRTRLKSVPMPVEPEPEGAKPDAPAEGHAGAEDDGAAAGTDGSADDKPRQRPSLHLVK